MTDISEKCSDACCSFEEKYGSTELMKAGISVHNRILVDKGIISVDELQERMLETVTEREKMFSLDPSHRTYWLSSVIQWFKNVK